MSRSSVQESFGGAPPLAASRGRDKLAELVAIMRRLAIHQATDDGGVHLRPMDYAMIQRRLTDIFEDLSLRGPVS